MVADVVVAVAVVVVVAVVVAGVIGGGRQLTTAGLDRGADGIGR